MLSAILSSYNELQNDVFWKNLSLLRSNAQIEVIIVDGGSTDGTQSRLGAGEYHLLPNSRRGQRYNHGLERAKGDIILFVHPRSLLRPKGLDLLLTLREGWGAFTHSFDWNHPLLRFTSWYSNHIRGRGRGIFYLDHCLYASRDLLADVRFPQRAVFEDTLFCALLRKRAWPRLLPCSVVTSSIRFRRNGIWRQSLLNQMVKIMFYLSVPDSWINRIYERGLSLN